MTNEEAKNVLITMKVSVEMDATPIITHKELGEALDLAIKALEQQPCEDCISRAEAIRQFIRWASDTDDTHAEVVDFSDILEYLPHKICPNCGADMRGEEE
jgi:ArsR family metal-binding transcriptional regulator